MPVVHPLALAALTTGNPYAPPKVDAGDTAWMLVAAALVLLMTPALALFYGGMVRAKNVLGMLMQNYMAMGIVSVLWVLFTFSLAFDKGRGASGNAFIGGLHFAFLKHPDSGVPGLPSLAIPLYVFVAFQLMFAIITPAVIVGATADRWRFGAFLVFVAVWGVVDYAVVAHWVFDPYGWLATRGVEDFAGGTVVETNAGAAGLAMCLVLGRRKGWPHEQMRPHNVPLVLLGAGLLWFGWLGFNAGAALSARGAVVPFLNTNVAAAAALLGWSVVERVRDGHATTLGAGSGAVAGLVAITPACAFVSPSGAIAIGVLAGVICAWATRLKFRLGFDDSLDVVAVHLVGGLIGMVALGFLGNAHYLGVNGLLYGGSDHLLEVQVEAVLAVTAYAFVVTFAVGTVIRVLSPGRTSALSAAEQEAGMDLVLHGETAYETGAIHSGGLALAGIGTRPPPPPPRGTASDR
ncbi:MAG TPA: ammonium transporter [Mycobacteriales bacterium]